MFDGARIWIVPQIWIPSACLSIYVMNYFWEKLTSRAEAFAGPSLLRSFRRQRLLASNPDPRTLKHGFRLEVFFLGVLEILGPPCGVSFNSSLTSRLYSKL